MTRDRVWVAPAAEEPSARSAVVERARRRGFTRFVLDVREPFEPRPGEEVVRRDGDRLCPTDASAPEVPVFRVSDPAGLDAALRSAPAGASVAIEWTGDRVIPLENAVASRRPGVRLWAYARGPEEVPGALGALEHGADAVVVRVEDASAIDRLESAVEGPLPGRLDWTTVPVRSVRAVGLGDRVLVDTTSLLSPGEGLLVGSAAAFLFHVASEAEGSAFSRPRPFRVNAGSAHSYVLMADGSTRYLSELAAGDAVLVCEPARGARAVRVGRIKIERRPMVLVHARDGDRDRTVFLQEAETVRLSGEPGRVPTTAVAAGARLHGVRLPAARHLGHAVEETIEER